MTAFLLILTLAALAALLVSYVRHDRFAGPAATSHLLDDLGPVEVRQHLVPRP